MHNAGRFGRFLDFFDVCRRREGAIPDVSMLSFVDEHLLRVQGTALGASLMGWCGSRAGTQARSRGLFLGEERLERGRTASPQKC